MALEGEVFTFTSRPITLCNVVSFTKDGNSVTAVVRSNAMVDTPVTYDLTIAPLCLLVISGGGYKLVALQAPAS